MVVFIGGIHGSGKGTFCAELSKIMGLNHYSASEVLKWNEISPDLKNKKVQNIPGTQKRLIKGLERIKETYSSFILDGHFCLFNAKGESEKIDKSTFLLINPSIIICVLTEVEDILQRLQIRDNRDYSFYEINQMQNLELTYSKDIANYLNIQHLIFNGKNHSEIINHITKLL